MHQLLTNVKKQLTYIFGTGSAREARTSQIEHAESYANSIEYFKRHAGEVQHTNPMRSPIFILSAGWRSGSTLLQRLISSSDKLVLWGEPFDRSNIIQSLAGTLTPFNDTWPPRDYIIDELDLSQISQKWIANLYPSETLLLEAHRKFVDTLFAEPIKELGATRWGIKEVRYGLKEALFLKLLYPDAKFIYLKRDLRDAYISYKNFRPAMNWYAKWPYTHAFTPLAFARHRAKLIGEFQVVQKLTGGLIVDYSELINNSEVIDKIDNYCNVQCNNEVLNNKVGSGLNSNVARRAKDINILENSLLTIGDFLGTRQSSALLANNIQE